MAFSEAISDFPQAVSGEANEFEYRALSTSAIASAIFGAVSLSTIPAGSDSLEYALMLMPIPLIGLGLGLYALSKIRAMPDQLSGRKFAIGGIVLSSIGAIVGLSYALMVHATEVPPGATRMSFYDFRPDEKDERAGIPIPKDVQALDNKRVFIKGYFRPDSSATTRNVRRFLLVRDNNTCCFGDQQSVKFYDQVLVDLVDNKTTDYKSGVYRIAGTLHLQPQNLMSMPQKPVYFLQADYIE